MRRCSWPICDQVGDIPFGMLAYCSPHAALVCENVAETREKNASRRAYSPQEEARFRDWVANNRRQHIESRAAPQTKAKEARSTANVKRIAQEILASAARVRAENQER